MSFTRPDLIIDYADTRELGGRGYRYLGDPAQR
jgi:hypothetical protein